MTDYTEMKRLAESIHGKGSTIDMLNRWAAFESACKPELILALIAENEALKGPHDWLAEDLIKELVDNAQAIQENADDGEEDPFVIVLLASASRIRRQEANIDKLRAENEWLAKTADCWDRLNVQNKALSDSFRAERDQLRAEVAGLRTGYEAYEQVNAELKAEVEESASVIDQLAKILAGVAVALKGEELPLRRHGYHDLVECVTVLRLENDLRKGENETLRKALESCAEELSAEVICKHGGQKLEDMHPVTRRLYDRDMASVIEARAALGKGDQS